MRNIMKKKLKIKIIKKGAVVVARFPVIDEKNSEKLTNRKMSSNVSEWVKEFQERRDEESI
jgi:hypothetical protein